MNRKPNTPMGSEELKRRLGVMHERFRAHAPGRIEDIEALWQRALEAPPGDPVRADLVLATHSLVGTAPTLGCEALGAAAARLESALRAAFGRSAPLTEEERAAISKLLGGLSESLA